MTRPMVLAVWVVGLLLTACGPKELAPLYRYGDAWEGEVRFGEEPAQPLRADIYVTKIDGVTAEHDYNNALQRTYAELSIGGKALAAWGEASHTDTRDISKTAYTPTPDKEFLTLNVLQVVRELAGASGSATRQQQYASTYAAFLSEHQLSASSDVMVELVGEKQGDVVEGVLVVLSTPREGGVGVRRLVGTFRLERKGIAPGRTVDDWKVETDRYLFHSEAQSGSLTPRIYIK